MDMLIFDMGGGIWGIADSPADSTLSPFGIDGAFLSYRLWRDASASDDQWDAAKAFFLRLAGDLRKPGRRGERKAAA